MAITQSSDNEQVTVPADALKALLAGWAEVTAHYGRDAVSAEADDAFDALSGCLR